MLVSGTRSWMIACSEDLKNIPVAPESLAILLVIILLLFLDKEYKVGSVFVFSYVKLQDSKTEPDSHLLFLFLYTYSLPPFLFLEVAVATCPGLGCLHDFESWLPIPWDQQ